jgi:predicted nuclease of predicted toxin-antitoxin system
MTRFLLDEGLPRHAVVLLRADGIDAVHTTEVGASGLEDEAIIELARAQQATVVTLDDDFNALLALSGASSPSVVHLRIQGLKAEATAALVRKVLAHCADDLDAGAVVSVQPGRLRVRRLPVLR